jgi:hypothetical protein
MRYETGSHADPKLWNYPECSREKRAGPIFENSHEMDLNCAVHFEREGEVQMI